MNALSRLARESEVPVVVLIPEKVKAGVAKRHCCDECFQEYEMDIIDG